MYEIKYFLIGNLMTWHLGQTVTWNLKDTIQKIGPIVAFEMPLEVLKTPL